MRLRIDTDARTPTERATAAAVLRAAAELLEHAASPPRRDVATEPDGALTDTREPASTETA